jgi:tyrosyl-tRNA synthetase
VQAAAQALFGRGELTGLDEATLAASLEDAGAVEIAHGEPATIVDLLVASGLCDSKGAARRAIGEGGAYVNNERVSDPEWTPTAPDLLHGSWLVLRRGKKNFAGVRIA